MHSDFLYPSRQAEANAIINPKAERANKTVIAPHADLRRQQGAPCAFAPERHGNAVTTMASGEHYFTEVCAAIQSARTSVFITGWQINWAVKLHGDTRLIDALQQAVDNGARVYVMPWQSPKAGVNTGDLGTMLAVFQLNAGRRDGIRAFCCPAGLQNDHTGIEEVFFSHHQKLVVIDARIAFVGGLDLAFGRRDDHRFTLEHDWRTGPEIYNGGIPAMHSLLPAEAQAYIDESELLRYALTVGPAQGLQDAQTTTSRQIAVSRLGKAYDSAVQWTRSPINLDDLPSWLRTPVQWGQAGVYAAAEPARRLFDQAQQQAADAMVQQLDKGELSEAHVANALALARTAVRCTYNALLMISWVNERPNQQLRKAGAQSAPSGGAVLRSDQPRMPWQDVHVRIEGPSVYDLARNFSARWNSVQHSYLAASLRERARIPESLLPKVPAKGAGNGGTGGVAVRVLRSAPLRLLRDEAAATPGGTPPAGAQSEIHDAMVAAIRGAQNFIYIENQFFQSAFGEPSIATNDKAAQSGPMRYMLASPATRVTAAVTRASAQHKHQLPRNRIALELGERIERAIQHGHAFHVYIILPVHPEGRLDDMTVVGQIHWTMQSLVFASDSLLNRVRLALYARKHCKEPRDPAQWEAKKNEGRVFDEGQGKRKFNTILDGELSPYLTLLNLRTAQTVAGKLRTEQVYVHSKLMIVDDRQVIVGTANINDRSLDGGRDSELAVLLTDLSEVKAPLDGKHSVPVRKLAHEMRKSLWRKHFALDGGNDVVQPAKVLEGLLDKPAAPETWQAIQNIANANQAAYAQAFAWLPRSEASIWPVWDRTKDDEFKKRQLTYEQTMKLVAPYGEQMPFSDAWWTGNVNASTQRPRDIRGFICALPLDWTLGENNHPGINLIALTQKGPDKDAPLNSGPVMAAHRPALNEGKNV